MNAHRRPPPAACTGGACACRSAAPSPTGAERPASRLVDPPAPPEPEGCSGGEAYALRVIGEDMAPEFEDGDIIVVEPDGALRDGRFVVARVDDGYLLRQLRLEAGAWVLCALNPACRVQARVSLGASLHTVHGVVIQKAVPGRRRLTRFYV